MDVTSCLEAIPSSLPTPSTTSAKYLASVIGKVQSPCIGGLRVRVGIEVTAEEPQKEEPARVCQDSERIGHGQAERIDMVLHIWSRVQRELKLNVMIGCIK